MNLEIPSINFYLGSRSGSIISLLTIFGGADIVVVKEFRNTFSKWLKNYDNKDILDIKY